MNEQDNNPRKLPSWPEFAAGLVTRAMTDEAFREALLADPRSAVEKELGEKLPAAGLKSHLKIKLIEQRPDELIIVLPPPASQLGESQLEQVAGGIAASDLVMTGGGPGPNSTPFVFKLEDIKMA